MGRLRQRIHIQKIFIQGLKGDWRILCANSDGVTNSKRLSKLLFAFFFFSFNGSETQMAQTTYCRLKKSSQNPKK